MKFNDTNYINAQDDNLKIYLNMQCQMLFANPIIILLCPTILLCYFYI